MIILVLDDHAARRSSLLYFLESCGHQAYSANCIEDSVAFSRLLHPGMVIVNLDIGDGSGWHAPGLIRDGGSRLGPRFVGLSGPGQVPDIGRIRECGFDQHLRRPLSFTDLQEELEITCTKPADLSLRRLSFG